MIHIHVICTGKMKEKFYIAAAEEYAKRLSRFCRLEIIELSEQKLPDSPSPAQIEQALEKEAEAIRARIPAGAAVVALCVEGQLRSSEELAGMIARCEQSGDKGLVFLIGSSFGLHPSLKAMAAEKLSMSPMTFPHHLARVMLLEQIYRGFQINSGSKYHK